MAEGLREMAFSDSNLADDENRGMLGQIASGSQVMDERTIEFWESIKVELIECFVGSKASAAQSSGELLLITSCDLVLDQQSQELGVGQFGIDGLTVASLKRIENPGQAQLLQVWCKLRDRVHNISRVDLTIIE
jgi:hypothetical protein